MSSHPSANADDGRFLGLDEARARILAALSPLSGWERVPVRAALGRVLAQDLIAPCNVPAHDNSAMDGFAVRAADLDASAETALKVVGTAFAGRPFTGMVSARQAVRIMTGAAIPPGADTIVVQEVVRRDGEQVFIPAGQRAGQNLRRAGEDLAEGAVALAAGSRCGAAELGLIASLGIGEVAVRRRLRVAFFSTGDEVASIGRPLAPGEIYDSNRYTLFGVLSALGCELIDMGVVADDPAALEAAMRAAADNADVIITSGGVSVGEADFIRELMARLGEVAFWKLAIKPGRPMAFGRIGNAVLFGLPGNPVAVMVTFHQLVQDALLTLMGVTPLAPPQRFPVRSTFAMKKQPGRIEYLRGRLQWAPAGPSVAIAASQGAGVLRSMSAADCYIVLPEDCSAVAEGDTVFVEPFRGLA